MFGNPRTFSVEEDVKYDLSVRNQPQTKRLIAECKSGNKLFWSKPQ